MVADIRRIADPMEHVRDGSPRVRGEAAAGELLLSHRARHGWIAAGWRGAMCRRSEDGANLRDVDLLLPAPTYGRA
jgi:hypothetical protein